MKNGVSRVIFAGKRKAVFRGGGEGSGNATKRSSEGSGEGGEEGLETSPLLEVDRYLSKRWHHLPREQLQRAQEIILGNITEHDGEQRNPFPILFLDPFNEPRRIATQ